MRIALRTGEDGEASGEGVATEVAVGVEVEAGEACGEGVATGVTVGVGEASSSPLHAKVANPRLRTRMTAGRILSLDMARSSLHADRSCVYSVPRWLASPESWCYSRCVNSDLRGRFP